MGLFHKKDKDKEKDKDFDTTGPRPEEHLLAPPKPQPPPTSTNNSYNDSTYYSSSDLSSNNNVQQVSRPPGQAPGTTVTTTTTTTTTTTVVSSDGTTHMYSHPYNPATDPPPETITNTSSPANGASKASNIAAAPAQALSQGPSQETVPQSQQRPDFQRMQSPVRKPAPIQTQLNNATNDYSQQDSGYPFVEPSSPTTTGGRTIPSRSDFRDSNPQRNSAQSLDTTTSGPASPYGVPPRSELRNSREYQVQPLNTGSRASLNEGVPLSNAAPEPARDNATNYARPGDPSSSYGQHQNEAQGAAQHPIRPEPQVQQPHVSKRQSLGTALRGIHGAGEVIRGSVNSKIAHGLHNAEEEERMRVVREQGMNDFKGSGLYDRTGPIRQKVEGGRRLRKRSLSRGPQLGHGLDVVDERPTP